MLQEVAAQERFGSSCAVYLCMRVRSLNSVEFTYILQTWNAAKY